MAKTSKTMLNSSGESGDPCLVPDFRGNAFNFPPLRTMFAVDLSHMAFEFSFSFISMHILISFISLSSLIAMAKTSKTMLNSSGESGHPRLVPDFRGYAFNFFALEDDVYCRFIIYGLYYVEVGSCYAHFLKSLFSYK